MLGLALLQRKEYAEGVKELEKVCYAILFCSVSLGNFVFNVNL